MFRFPRRLRSAISPRVLRRRAATELLDLLAFYGQAAVTRGRSLTWSRSFPSQTAYRAAVCRLRKAGVIAYRRARDGKEVLELTGGGGPRDVLVPHRFWGERWRGLWSVLIYDIPEENRRFRDTLRRYLRQLRMGCLQKSVWISPRDIRPEFDDLKQAVGIEFVSHLFEATTVLDEKPQDLARRAWDFERLGSQHRAFLAQCDTYLDQLRRADLGRTAVESMAREELSAYLAAMENDPLLPKSLLPPGYKGQAVFHAHRQLVREIGKRLRRS